MWYDVFFTNVAAVAVFLLVLLLFLLRSTSRPAHLPPGPTPWPLIGNLRSLRGDLFTAIQKLRSLYGDVYLLYMGSTPTVFVHDLGNIREVLVTRGEDFADRPYLMIAEKISKGKGVVNTSGQTWKEQRRYTLHTLRDFGFGKSSLEQKVMEEVEVFIQCLRNKNGESFGMDKLLHTSVSNIICSVVFGNRFEHEDPKFVKYMRAVDENLESLAFAGPINFLPWLKYIPGDLFKYHRTLRNVDMVEAFILDEIKTHKDTLNPDEPRDFIDAYLSEIARCQDDKSSTFEEEQLLKVIGDLFVAGSETTATTLQWALLYMINYPDVQAKVRAEIHAVIGRGRFPTMADRKHMPYMEATLMEIQRCGDVAPLGVPHSTSRNTTLAGYVIPKDTTVITVLCSLHGDPNVFKNPKTFSPSRFLDSDGNVVKSESLLPFSAGKRVCLGESLARMELFLFLTSILQRFVFKAPEGVTSLPEEGLVGLTHSPRPYELRAICEE